MVNQENGHISVVWVIMHVEAAGTEVTVTGPGAFYYIAEHSPAFFMADYLPVLPILLVSLSTNALNVIPDDSALSTAPRAQVDYLSHDWEEEDVWRSWRNMTRQKNAIANGARLENASWRTWWKQRNKLGTISPETLNWSVSIFFIFERQSNACEFQAQRFGCNMVIWPPTHSGRVETTTQTSTS